MHKKLCAGLLLAIASTTAQAEVIDLNVSDEAARLSVSGPLRISGAPTGATYDLGYLFSDKRDGELNLGHAGLLVSGDAGAQGFDATLGLGLRLIVADQRGNTGGAVAIGGQFDLRLPQYNRFGLVGNLYFAPDVLGFSDVERYVDATVTLEYQVLRNAAIYAGHRQVRIKVDDRPGSNLRDNSWIGGIRIQF